MPTRSEGATRVVFNLFTLQKRLELAKGHTITQEQIAEGAGLHINTIYGMFKNTSKRVELLTLEKLVDYFNSQGLEIGISDIFTIRPKADDPE